MMNIESPLPRQAFIDSLRGEGLARYHHEHPFHILMHEGRLTREQLQLWVVNRYYYQTRIPIKDALIVSKSEDASFRRAWIRRVHDHDGDDLREGGLVLWRRLAMAVGVDEETLRQPSAVLPGVRFACDQYVSFVRSATLLEAVASSLTELFAPDLMIKRIAAWERHYPWVDPQALEYFRSRIACASRDSSEALEFVVTEAATRELQRRCIAALVLKTEILWHVLDTVYAASILGRVHDSDHRSEPSQVGT